MCVYKMQIILQFSSLRHLIYLFFFVRPCEIYFGLFDLKQKMFWIWKWYLFSIQFYSFFWSSTVYITMFCNSNWSKWFNSVCGDTIEPWKSILDFGDEEDEVKWFFKNIPPKKTTHFKLTTKNKKKRLHNFSM